MFKDLTQLEPCITLTLVLNSRDAELQYSLKHHYYNMLMNLDFDQKVRSFIVKRVINISISTTYYIFCCRNKAGTNPELLNF